MGINFLKLNKLSEKVIQKNRRKIGENVKDIFNEICYEIRKTILEQIIKQIAIESAISEKLKSRDLLLEVDKIKVKDKTIVSIIKELEKKFTIDMYITSLENSIDNDEEYKLFIEIIELYDEYSEEEIKNRYGSKIKKIEEKIPKESILYFFIKKLIGGFSMIEALESSLLELGFNPEIQYSIKIEPEIENFLLDFNRSLINLIMEGKTNSFNNNTKH